ncbi:MAG: hypothetical protein K9M55_03420 [Candidatus Marinimicrobia bacterium]|nr:hypothetical protein [Candidatus Neomarinimicrobiota bacterium]MCF7921728.1 hypothetical protein [Candidatus Neomarinimicrobiota bacterium]
MMTFMKIFISLLIFGNVMAGVIKPENGKNFRDILIVSGNRSSYYALDDESLIYKVKGPQRLKIYSRAVLTSKKSESQAFEFEIQLNGNQPIQVNHQQKYSRGVKSPQHPNHYFSKSATDYITIPAGVNQVTLRPKKRGQAMVVRVLEESQGPRGKKKRVEALSEEAPIKLIYQDKRLSYYAMTKDHPLFVTMEGPVNLEIISRLGFSPQMGREQDYRIQILDNGKLVGTYYFSTDRSEATTVEGQKDVVPGSWRSCDIKLGKGMHEIKLKFMDDNRQVFIKLNQIVGD